MKGPVGARTVSRGALSCPLPLCRPPPPWLHVNTHSWVRACFVSCVRMCVSVFAERLCGYVGVCLHVRVRVRTRQERDRHVQSTRGVPGVRSHGVCHPAAALPGHRDLHKQHCVGRLVCPHPARVCGACCVLAAARGGRGQRRGGCVLFERVCVCACACCCGCTTPASACVQPMP